MTLEPKWVGAARDHLDIIEAMGPQNNVTIMGWARRMGGWIADYFHGDDIPWCAVFINQCLFESGIKATYSLAAASYLAWGVKLSEPRLGCVVVLSRPGGHHVFFYLGHDREGRLVGIGGNQSNRVSVARFDPSRVLGYRWPTEGAIPAYTGRVVVDAQGLPVSTQEG